jgi:aldehyde dehydrogenase (NAD+)
VPEASQFDVNAAVASAKAAFPTWSDLSPIHRAPYFKRLASLIREHQAELAQLEALSMGRPVSRYYDCIAAAGEFEYYSEANLELGTSSLNSPNMVNFTLRQPYGVVAVIIPWNLPLIFFGKKAAPALMAGNTVVLKSSEKAPLTVRRLTGFHCTLGRRYRWITLGT